METYKKLFINKPVILWGGTMYGEIAYKIVKDVYGGEVIAIIDNKFRKLNWTDTPIIRSSELSSLPEADILICAANSFELIRRQLEKYKKENPNIRVFDIRTILYDFRKMYVDNEIEFSSSYIYGDLDLEEIVERYSYYAGSKNGYENRLYLSYCVLCITSKCSLKCKNCAAFITHYQNKEDYGLAYVREELGKIIDAVDGIMELELMGGEPFLCTEFNDILSWCIQQNKIRAIKIVTNGTIIPVEATWDLLRNNKVKLVIDDYGKYSYKFNEIITMAAQKKVRYEKQVLQSWYLIEPIIKHGFTREKLSKIFQECNFRTCMGITNGRFYRCNVTGHMNTVGLLDDENSDYIQLQGMEYSPEILREKLKDLIHKDYIQGCDWCNMYQGKEVAVAEQISNT